MCIANYLLSSCQSSSIHTLAKGLQFRLLHVAKFLALARLSYCAIHAFGLITEPELQVQISTIIIIAAVMNINNYAGSLVYYYDVGNFHATIFKYTRAMHVSATTCMVQ